MCKKNVMIGVLSAMLLLGSAVVQADVDVFSVNFYAYNGVPGGQEENVTLEADQSAGFDDWLTTGWENILMPWNPGSPQDPVSITSVKGATATFTLIDVRNGGGSQTAQGVRTVPVGDGNGDLMDGAGWGTQVPADPGKIFDMAVSDITLAVYDVIIYLAAHAGAGIGGDGTGKITFNGAATDFTSGVFDGTFTEIVDSVTPGNYIVYKNVSGSSFTVQVWGTGNGGYNHIGPHGFQIRQANPQLAADPDPADEVTDVLRDVILSWTSGESANTHNVYLGTVFDDVNDAVLADAVSPGQTDTTYDPGRLEFEKTYYWRVDEVNAPPTSHVVFKGDVWSFTTEPIAYPIDGNNITATASSTHQADTGPENTINGSGLDANDLHAMEPTDMWLSFDEPNGAWIEYELDKVYKLHQMWVWNHNATLESVLGFGLKDVTIEYSTNGTDYTPLGTTHEFVRAPGLDDYAHNTTIDFGSAAAKYVKITANSNWGDVLDQYGLSEVRFFSIPVFAREPSPDSGTTDVAVDVTLGFRAGREAAEHNVYLSTDEQTVIDGNAPVTTVTKTSYGPLSLDLSTTYYWKINEVNDVETTTTWQGDIWNFTTHEFFIVDDFEDYNDYPPDEIWATWVDGYGDPTNGATVGYPAPDWNLDEHYVETTIVHGGDQSMPLYYDNSTAGYSEATVNVANLQVGQDWTKHGIKALTLRFFGDPNNAVEQMYVKVNGSKVTYDGDAENIRRTGWQMWYIDLADFGLDLSNVTELSIGFERIGAFGGQGVVYFDDFRLYSHDRQLVTPADAGTDGLVAHWKLDETSGLIAADSSGYGNDGTLTGMAGDEWTTGVLDGALEFDAVDNHISIPVGGPYSTFTVSLWISPASSTNDWTTLIGGANHVIGTRGPDDLRWLYYDGDSYYADTSVTLDAWNHLAVVRDGSSVTFHLNGVYDGEVTVSGDMDFTIIGAWSPGVESFGGLMDDVRIYDRALTPEEAVWLAGRTMPFDKPF